MLKNYGINIFDYEGPRSLTHTVGSVCVWGGGLKVCL